MKPCFALSLLVGLAAAGGALALDLPTQKPGLWETTVMTGGQTITMQMCLDAAFARTNSAFSAQVRKNSRCTNLGVNRTATGWTSTTTCTRADGKVETNRSDVVGSLDSRFTITVRSPPTAPPKMTMTQTLVGPCKPGQKGGDAIVNGHVMHMGAMMQP